MVVGSNYTLFFYKRKGITKRKQLVNPFGLIFGNPTGPALILLGITLLYITI